MLHVLKPKYLLNYTLLFLALYDMFIYIGQNNLQFGKMRVGYIQLSTSQREVLHVVIFTRHWSPNNR